MSFSVFLLSAHNWQTSVSAKLLQRKPSMLKIVLPAQILKFAESAQEFWKAYISWTLNFSSLVHGYGKKAYILTYLLDFKNNLINIACATLYHLSMKYITVYNPGCIVWHSSRQMNDLCFQKVARQESDFLFSPM